MSNSEGAASNTESNLTNAVPPAVHMEATAELSLDKTPPSEPTAFKLDEHLPERFKGDDYKGWLDPIRGATNPNQLEVLLDQSWNAQKKLGEKSLKLPGEGATPEELNEWRKAIGVPEKPEDYKFEPTAWTDEEKELGEILTKSRGDEYMAKVNKMFHDIGIPPKQAEQLMHAFDKLTLAEHNEFIGKLAESQKQLDEDFDTRANRWYGQRKDAVMQSGKKLVDAALADPQTPEDAKAVMQNLGNDLVLSLAPILDYVARKYMREDSSGLQNSLTTPNSSAMSREQLRLEIRRLQGMPEYVEGRGAKFEEIRGQINDLSKQVVQMDKQAAGKR